MTTSTCQAPNSDTNSTFGDHPPVPLTRFSLTVVHRCRQLTRLSMYPHKLQTTNTKLLCMVLFYRRLFFRLCMFVYPNKKPRNYWSQTDWPWEQKLMEEQIYPPLPDNKWKLVRDIRILYRTYQWPRAPVASWPSASESTCRICGASHFEQSYYLGYIDHKLHQKLTTQDKVN